MFCAVIQPLLFDVSPIKNTSPMKFAVSFACRLLLFAYICKLLQCFAVCPLLTK
jgi:hypothetical protein